MRKRTIVIAISLIFVSAGALMAQDKGSKAQEIALAAKPTPRTADGHPNLTGFWGDLNRGFAVTVQGNKVTAGLTTPAGNYDNDPDKVAARVSQFVGADPSKPDERIPAGDLRRQAQYAKDPNLVPPYKPELLAKVKDLSEHANNDDPAFHCRPPGVPRMGPPLQIIQTPGKVVLFYELIKGSNYFRIIPTDGRPHGNNKNVDGTYMGDSVGHWDGDTLVIDSVNFTDDTWLGNDGWFHSDKLHVIERLTRKGDTIKYESTVEDPVVLTRPWVKDPMTLTLNTDPTAVIFEQGPCIESDSEHLVNNDRN